MKAPALPPPLAEPKKSASWLAQSRAQGARSGAMDEAYDERMRKALAERATRPVQAKKAVGSGYGDLVVAARANTAAPPVTQQKLRVGSPSDPLEREADALAERMIGEGAPQPVFSLGSASPVQRSCSACAPAAPCSSCAKEDRAVVQRKENGASAPAGVLSDDGLLGLGPGRALDAAARAYFEPRFGRDLGDVRVHTDAASAGAARALGADAFTHGRDIYFAEGRYRPETAEGRRLLAHELVHTVQQGATAAPPAAAPPAAAPPAAEPPTPAAEPPAPTSIDVSTSSGVPAIQRSYSFGEFVSDVGDVASGAASAVGDVASDAAGAAWDAGASALEAGGEVLVEGAAFLVRQVSPELASMIEEGPLAFVQRNVERVLRGFFGSIFNVDLGAVAAALRDSLGASFDAFAAAMKGGVASACQLFADALGAIRDLASAITDNPVVSTLREIFGSISDAITKVTSAVAAPVFDLLGDLLGGAWDALKGVAKTVWGWIQSVRDLASSAWDWVAEKLGFGGKDASGEDGIFGWLKRQASEVWESIKETFAPIVGPLKTLGKILLALSPIGPLYAIVKYGPQVVSAVQWLWANRGDPDIIRAAHREMGGTFLPGFLDSLAGFREKLEGGASWLLEQLGALSSGLLEFLGGLTGVPLLSVAEDAVRAIASGVETLLGWVQSGLQTVVGSVTSVASSLWGIVAPYKDVLSSIALAIMNPGAIPLILAGWAWEALPSCFKPPIIDFLLDIAIGALDMAPELIIFGPLWPLLKSGVLGFLRRLRAQPPETKEAIANKIVRILRGSSPDFIVGFVKGFLTGVWEGISDPFKAIWMVIEGLNHALTFFERLAEDALTPARDRQPAAPAEGAAPAAVTPTGAAPAPSGATAEDLGARATEMASELEPPVTTVTDQFWAAVGEYFDGSGGGSFDTLITKLGALWEAMRTRVEQAGGDLANKVIEFFTGDAAEGTLGEAVGWLAGNIAFQVALDVITAGTWAAAYPALQVFVRFLNWPMEVLGHAAKLLSKIGKYIVDGVKKLGSLVTEAGGGALKAVKEALGVVGEKLAAFAEELLSRFGRGAAREGAEAAERGATHAAESGLAHEAEQEAVKRAEQAALHETEERAARGTGQQATREAEEQAAREAEQKAAREAEERGAKKSEREAAEEAAEIPAAKAAARAIEVALEARGAPLPVLFAALEAGLMPRFRWIKGFKSRRLGLGYLIYIVASEIPTNEDNPYGDEPRASAGETGTTPEGKPAGETGKAPEGGPETTAAADLKEVSQSQRARQVIESQEAAQRANVELVSSLRAKYPEKSPKEIADLAAAELKVPEVPFGYTAEQFADAQHLIKNFLQENGLPGAKGFVTGSRVTGATFNPKKATFGQKIEDFTKRDLDITLITDKPMTADQQKRLWEAFQKRFKTHKLGIRNISDPRQLEHIPIYGKLDLGL
jgi:hypothetical protein